MLDEASKILHQNDKATGEEVPKEEAQTAEKAQNIAQDVQVVPKPVKLEKPVSMVKRAVKKQNLKKKAVAKPVV